MAQHDYDLANGTGAAFRSDANAALAAILTLNSGASEPTTRQAYMLWADTTAGQLKIRNAANNAWIVVGALASANLGLVPATGGSQANASGSATAPSYSFSGDTNTGAYRPEADVYAITTNGTERVRVTLGGYLKASNAGSYFNPVAFNHELRNASATDNVLVLSAPSSSYSSNALQIYAERNTTNTSFKVIDYFNVPGGNVRFSVFDSGQILSVGSYDSTTANAANLTIAASGAIQRSTSSRIYKTDIQPVEDAAADVVLSLNPVRYRSLADGDNSDWSYYGLIAEDVAALDPRLVHWGYRDEDYEVVTEEQQRYNEETEEVETVDVNRRQLKEGAALKPEGVQYDRIGVLTLSLVQRHEARIAELERRLAELA